MAKVSGRYAFEVLAPPAAAAKPAPAWLLIASPLIVLVVGGAAWGLACRQRLAHAASGP